METEYVIHKLISSLSRLSDGELHDLADLLHRDDVGDAFERIVQNTIQLRRAERSRRSRATHGETHFVGASERKQPVRASEHPRDKFFAFLNDRRLFPSTRDVVQVLNDAFELSFRYEDYRKRGRRDLIQKCWRQFEDMPLTERRKVLRLLSRRTPHHPFSSEGYHELFRILSQK